MFTRGSFLAKRFILAIPLKCVSLDEEIAWHITSNIRRYSLNGLRESPIRHEPERFTVIGGYCSPASELAAGMRDRRRVRRIGELRRNE